MSNSSEFIAIMNSPWKVRLFLFSRLPSAFFSGVRIRSLRENSCVVTVPFKWFSQNPFRSTYFACLAMAGEMSTGALAMLHVYKRKPAVSMLVVKMEANYHKKATGRTTFTCDQGEGIKNAIEHTLATGEAVSFTARTTGMNDAGEQVASFDITWSFKRKSGK